MFGERLRRANRIARRRYRELRVETWYYPGGNDPGIQVGHFRKWNTAHGNCGSCSRCDRWYKKKGWRKRRYTFVYRLNPRPDGGPPGPPPSTDRRPDYV